MRGAPEPQDSPLTIPAQRAPAPPAPATPDPAKNFEAGEWLITGDQRPAIKRALKVGVGA